MDAIGWVITALAVGLVIAVIAAAPRLKRVHLRRQLEGGGGSFAGVGVGLDAVWRPSADEARADWEAQVEMPAPAPTPGDKGRVEDGRIVIELEPGDRASQRLSESATERVSDPARRPCP